MIEFINISKDLPYIIFKKLYKEAYKANQNNIEAALVSSFSKENNEVDARFVNIKFIEDKKFIFFSNYNSPKALQFNSHNQISCVIFWSKINTQIRIKANIYKSEEQFSNEYFFKRDKKKNALAIASNQSNKISSYEDFIRIYNKTLREDDLTKRPEFWGGYYFQPYSFEFWKGQQSRLNQRDKYELKNGEWAHSVLQP